MPDGSWSKVVLCVDDLSKLVILDILSTRQADDLQAWMLKHAFGPYGRHLHVRSDSGNEFVGAFTGFLQVYNVKHIQSRPHSPWTNGGAERMVKTTKECILMVQHGYQGKEWQLLIPYLQNAINACVAKATGLVPPKYSWTKLDAPWWISLLLCSAGSCRKPTLGL